MQVLGSLLHVFAVFSYYIYNYLNTQLAAWSSKAILEKLMVVQLVKIFPTFYGSRKFITVFTRARYWALS